MEIFHAAVLGVVQGLAEFLPISSSAHLVLVPWAFKWEDLGPTFDVALHLGTLFAIIIYFWKDWLEILAKWKEGFVWLLVAGCIPAAIFGYKFEKYFETTFRSPLLIGIFMIAMGILLWAAEAFGKKYREMGTVNLGDSLFIGFAQVLALMPGVSRSGITMTAGLFKGLKRETAARFSFLLATPIIAGAGLLKLKEIVKFGIPHSEINSFLIGILFAAVFGYFAIKYLLKYLQNHSMYIFVWYRVIAGIAILMLYFARRSL
jgi:undecaprenyl-diphosphatase